MELAPNLHRIGNDIVAAYLISDTDGVTVIDAGLPGHYRDLIRELSAMGRTIDDVKGIVLTHGDSDHVGFAERARRDHGIPVYIHEGDADRAKGGTKGTGKGGPMKLAAFGFIGYALRKGGVKTTWLKEVVELHGGETLDLPGKPRIISLPGHSAGSIAIHSPAVDAVFVGDGLTTRHVLTGQVGPQPAPFTDEPEQAIASLAVLPQATWVLPGHGAPFSGGTAEAVATVTA
jgi:glyoxylase-like metal-dependent hydrolase (beta-lactamase superfamily II)